MLFIINAAVLFAVLLKINHKQYLYTNLRISFVQVLIFMSFATVLVTEVNSFFNRIATLPISIAWIILLILNIFLLIRLKNREIRFELKDPGITNSLKYLLAGVALLIMAPLFFLAVACPPNNWDSMTYHLPRLEHWIQNGNVSFYPTANVRQLYLAPVAEYLLLNLKVLFRSDYYLNLLQYFFMFGSAIAASLIAKVLGSDKRGQILAAILVVTLPMGILQSTTTQNDQVVSFFALVFVYFSAMIALKRDASGMNIIMAVLALSLGLFTKATMLLVSLPFIIWLSIMLLIRNRRALVKFVALCALMIAVVGGGFIGRNIVTFGSPLGPKNTSTLHIENLNGRITVGNTISNIIKNTGNHLSLPIGGYNRFLNKSIYGLHRLMGLKVDNRETDFLGCKYRTIFLIHEDYSGNFLMLMLIWLSIAIAIGLLHRPDVRYVSIYFICIFSTQLLFATLLRWQPWQSRLELPVFIITCPVVARYLDIFIYGHNGVSVKTKDRFITATGGILIFFALPFIFINSAKPFLNYSLDLGNGFVMSQRNFLAKTRLQNYFNNNPAIRDVYLDIGRKIAGNHVSNIGLCIGGDDYEYPLWLILRQVEPRVILKYVSYNQVLSRTPNVDKLFLYNALIGGSKEVIALQKTEDIKNIYDYGNIKLIIMNKYTDKTFLH